MVSVSYDEGKGWHSAEVLPYGPIALDPAAAQALGVGPGDTVWHVAR